MSKSFDFNLDQINYISLPNQVSAFKVKGLLFPKPALTET